MDGKHSCQFLISKNSIAIYKEESTWTLSLYKEATEEDLESNHYLEMVGELIEKIKVPIIHCPYCGEKLEGELEIDRPLYQYIDYSKW
ncbi:hypothetical protein BCU68_03050 [Vibrio sp. 10N.286.49.B3]|uniref:YgiT-type zinc finger protein n=1 Tax=Vibrio sp. 10N.286.49.B3 TaxID=1880855 RepID=UPI000C852081|nr:YgiT-type zinc finger protein [Vibrio sp. 10N.286.49.B3]PMH44495.1 hypothetical protein BCU68_03050 [Vibrio sp. 10N.286.49.B3]